MDQLTLLTYWGHLQAVNVDSGSEQREGLGPDVLVIDLACSGDLIAWREWNYLPEGALGRWMLSGGSRHFDPPDGGTFEYSEGMTAADGRVVSSDVVHAADGGWSPHHLFLYKTDGGPSEQLTAYPADQIKPTLRRNLLAYLDNRSGDWHIYSLELNTGVERPVVTSPGNQDEPRLIPQGALWQERDAGFVQIFWNPSIQP